MAEKSNAESHEEVDGKIDHCGVQISSDAEDTNLARTPPAHGSAQKRPKKKRSKGGKYNRHTPSPQPLPTEVSYKQRKKKIVLVGKTGAGKSTFGNFILSAAATPDEGTPHFEAKGGLAHCSIETSWNKCVLGNVELHIIDTPGFGYVENAEQKDDADAMFEFGRALSYVHSLVGTETEEGVDAVVFCIPASQRYAMECTMAMTFLEKLGGDFLQYVIPVFTLIDLLEEVPPSEKKQRKTIKKFAKDHKCLDNFKRLMSAVDDDFMVVNSKDKSPENLQEKTAELLKLIERIAKKAKGKKYTNYLCRKLFEVAESKECAVREVLQEEIKKVQSKHEQEKEKHSAEIERLTNEFDRISCGLGEQEDELKKLRERELQSLKTEVKDYENMIARLLERKESKQNCATEIGLECEKIQRKLADIEEEKMFVDQKYQTATGEQQSLLEEKGKELSEKQVRLTTVLQKLKQQAKDTVQDQQHFESRAREREERKLSLEAQVRQLESELAQRDKEREQHHLGMPASSLTGSERHEEEPMPTPTAVPGQHDKKGQECFPGDAVVITKDGPKSVSDLVPGEEVLCAEASSTITFYSEFLTFLHKASNKEGYRYLEISTTKGTRLHISSNHLIFTVDEALRKTTPHAKFAGEVTTSNAILCLQSPPSHELCTEPVESIAVVRKPSAYAPLTRNGTIVVNRALVSCYASFPIHDIAHRSLLPLRLYSTLTKNHKRKSPKQGVHPYASFLHRTVTMAGFKL